MKNNNTNPTYCILCEKKCSQGRHTQRSDSIRTRCLLVNSGQYDQVKKKTENMRKNKNLRSLHSNSGILLRTMATAVVSKKLQGATSCI